MSTVELVNFGCRLNIAEGEAIREAFSDGADILLFNTCAVTAEAERQARQAIRKAARLHPAKKIVVTGCAAEVSRERFAAMPEVAQIISQHEKRALIGPAAAMSGADHARAFVEVQNGCDHDCTFCITTLARGESRSVSAPSVISAVQKAVARGQQEVILTGVDLTSYGQDQGGGLTLGSLTAAILREVPDLPRLRLSSLDCIEMDDQLFEIVTSEPRLMPHLHLSLQSGDDMILKRMKRRHLRRDAVDLVQRIKARRSEITIGADIIAGFPTEDEAMFEGSLRLVEECDIVFGHIFPYSPRPGTAAARMPQLDRALIKERAVRLRGAALAHKAKWLATLVGSRQRMLVERDGTTGHAENYAQLRLEAPAMPGAIIDVLVVSSNGSELMVRA